MLPRRLSHVFGLSAVSEFDAVVEEIGEETLNRYGKLVKRAGCSVASTNAHGFLCANSIAESIARDLIKAPDSFGRE